MKVVANCCPHVAVKEWVKINGMRVPRMNLHAQNMEQDIRKEVNCWPKAKCPLEGSNQWDPSKKFNHHVKLEARGCRRFAVLGGVVGGVTFCGFGSDDQQQPFKKQGRTCASKSKLIGMSHAGCPGKDVMLWMCFGGRLGADVGALLWLVVWLVA